MCQHFQCLPQAGGLYDQDALTMHAFELVAAAQTQKQESEAKIKKASPTSGLSRYSRRR